MAKHSKTRCIGILNSGGDCPGLNAAIRGVTKAAMNNYGIRVIGIKDGFRGLVENRVVDLEDADVSGILTTGGTILRTSRDKPHKMKMGNQILDMSQVAANNIKNLQIDCLVCLGGGGTQKNAYNLHKATGIPVMTLPKTIDNDVCETDVSFGFDTAMQTATEAIDRLHNTATSHKRIIICEVMGHNAGWLTLGSGTSGGADIILIPEIPYDFKYIVESILDRKRQGKNFSIIVLAEGILSKEEYKKIEKEKDQKNRKKLERKLRNSNHMRAAAIAEKLEELTDLESRVTTLGHVVRGGIPSARDRHICTVLGTKAAELLAEGEYNVMISYRNDKAVPVNLKDVAFCKKFVPPEHPWVKAARFTGTCFGDYYIHSQSKFNALIE